AAHGAHSRSDESASGPAGLCGHDWHLRWHSSGSSGAAAAPARARRAPVATLDALDVRADAARVPEAAGSAGTADLLARALAHSRAHEPGLPVAAALQRGVA